MARIAGVNIPDDKHACVSLTYIYGIGRTSALRISERLSSRADGTTPTVSQMRKALVRPMP